MLKILSILLLFLGEAVAIFAEVYTAKNYSNGNALSDIILKALIIVFIGGGFLIFGYTFGYKAFKNIWIVSAISITSILIIEPIINYSIFRQVPTSGALIGLILGATGFIFAIFYK